MEAHSNVSQIPPRSVGSCFCHSEDGAWPVNSPRPVGLNFHVTFVFVCFMLTLLSKVDIVIGGHRSNLEDIN